MSLPFGNASFKIRINILLTSTLRSSKFSLFFHFTEQTTRSVSHLTYACYITSAVTFINQLMRTIITVTDVKILLYKSLKDTH